MITEGFRRLSIAVVLALSLASAARAQSDDERPPVSLSLDACAELAVDRVRSIVAAELGALLVSSDGADPAETTQVTVACDESWVTLHVVDPVTGKTLERRIAQDSLHPVARERFLALAIAELVAASWIELEVSPTPAVEPADRTASDDTRESARQAATDLADRPLRTEGSVRGSLLGLATMIGDPLRGSYGGGLRLDHEPHELVGWSVSVWGEHGDVGTDLGSVAIEQLGAQLEATLRLRFGIALLQIGAGVRGGAVWMRGDAAGREDVGARSFVAPVLGPHLALRVWVEPTRGLYVGLGASFSWTALSAHGLVDGVRTVNVDGPALVGELALGLRID